MLNDKYKLNHCKEMGAEPGRRFLTQPAEKQEPVIVAPERGNWICVLHSLHGFPGQRC